MNPVALAPVMPISEAPETAFAIYTTLMFLTTAGFGVWWWVSERHTTAFALPLILLGGFLSGFSEAWLDNVVLFGWPPEQNLGLFEAYGRTVPIFVPVGYAWFCGGLLYLASRIYARGVEARHIWIMLGVVVFVDFVAIAATDWFGIAFFFGDPPFEIFGYPLWWAAIDGTDVILGGMVLFFLIPRLKGWNQLWLVLVPPIMIGAAAGAVGWPVSTAINSGWSDPAKWAAGTLTITGGLAITYLVTRIVPAFSQGRGTELLEVDER